MNQAAESQKQIRLTAAQDVLYQILGEAFPGFLTRERLCTQLGELGRPTSRVALRQQIHRLEAALGKGSLQFREESVRLSQPIQESEKRSLAPRANPRSTRPDHDKLVENFRDTVLGVAEFSRDEARILLLSQSWFSRALPSTSLQKLLNVTRPANSESPLFSEHRNLETLVLMSQGISKFDSLVRLQKSKKIARQLGHKSAYRTASILEMFATAGESELASVPEMSVKQLEAIPSHQRLGYLATLFLEHRLELALRTTEAIVPLMARESPSDQLHFWSNSTVLSYIPEGRSFAAEARRRCQEAPGWRFDLNSQRCVLMSLARDRLHDRDVDGAEAAAKRYWEISNQMGWSSFDAHEILAQTSQMKGDILAARRYRDAWIQHLKRSGHSQKRFHLSVRKRFDSIIA